MSNTARAVKPSLSLTVQAVVNRTFFVGNNNDIPSFLVLLHFKMVFILVVVFIFATTHLEDVNHEIICLDV